MPSHVIEHAKTGRALCRVCEQKIAAGALRFGERLPNPYDEKEGGEMVHWFHLACAAFARPEPFLEAMAAGVEPFDDRERLEREARLGVEHRRLPRVRRAERATSGRASCRACKALIDKGALRIALAYYESGRFAPSGFIHATCAAAYLETTDVLGRVTYFSPELTGVDLVELKELVAFRR